MNEPAAPRPHRCLSWKLLFSLVCLLLALVPPVGVVSFLSVLTAHNPSNDEVMIVEVLGNILSGNYSWLRFPRDVFLNGHLEVFPTLVHAVLAKFFAWDLSLALYLGVGL